MCRCIINLQSLDLFFIQQHGKDVGHSEESTALCIIFYTFYYKYTVKCLQSALPFTLLRETAFHQLLFLSTAVVHVLTLT